MQERLKKNCYAFIEATKEAEYEKIEEMRLLLENKPDLLDDFTDTIMSILIEGHKPIKAYLVGKLAIALSVGEITLEEFQVLSQVIQTASAPALISLQSFMDGNNGKLYTTGHSLIKEEPLITSIGLASRYGNAFRISDFGHKLYLYGFQGKQSPL